MLVVDDRIGRGVPDDVEVLVEMTVRLLMIRLISRGSGLTCLVDAHEFLCGVLGVPVERREFDLLRIPAHIPV